MNDLKSLVHAPFTDLRSGLADVRRPARNFRVARLLTETGADDTRDRPSLPSRHFWTMAHWGATGNSERQG